MIVQQEPVQAAIWHCLNHYDYPDAVFLAELLCNEVDSDEAAFTLATCYYRTRQPKQALAILKARASKTPQCRYLLARCAYDLKQYNCVEATLTGVSFSDIKHMDQIAVDFGEVACFALQLLAQVCAATERFDLAAEANKRALQLNPFLWHVFAHQCYINKRPDPQEIFQYSGPGLFATCQGQNASAIVAFPAGPASGASWSTAPAAHDGSIHQTPVASGTGGAPTFLCDLQTPHNYGAPHHGLITPQNNHHHHHVGHHQHPHQHHNHYHQPAGAGNSALETPVPTAGGAGGGALDAMDTSSAPGVGPHQTPYRKQFRYLSSISPSTPSFGFLPMSSPADLSGVGQPPQLQSTCKQLRSGQLSAAAAAGAAASTAGGPNKRKETPLQMSKPMFYQMGGNITPRTPNNNAGNGATAGAVAPIANQTLTGQHIRRSSRLSFVNSSAVKENHKAQTGATGGAGSTGAAGGGIPQKFPVRKTKQRVSKMNLANSALNELNSDTLDKADQATSASTGQATANRTAAKCRLDAAMRSGGATAANRPASDSADAPFAFDAQHLNQLTAGQQMLYMKRNSAEGLFRLLRELGEAYVQLTHFRCRRAIELFGRIPAHHYRGSWVQTMLAKAHFEINDYDRAAWHFHGVHKREPYRMHMMEIYSTALWHLQREYELSALANDLVANDRHSPVAWCASGNCFSLLKDHESAIKLFERAVLVDPDFAYSYTLLGHELVFCEELDKALSCFRTAIQKDVRHYNAWFGVGTVYSKQGHFVLAELNFRRALAINPHNPVIRVHIATMQFATKQPEEALATLNVAIQQDAKNPFCKFHRSMIYFQMGKDREALEELKELKLLLPKESVVYYMIGKIHKKMGNVAAALKHFSWATDLDPRGANNQIKDAYEANMSIASSGGSGAGNGSADDSIVGGGNADGVRDAVSEVPAVARTGAGPMLLMDAIIGLPTVGVSVAEPVHFTPPPTESTGGSNAENIGLADSPRVRRRRGAVLVEVDGETLEEEEIDDEDDEEEDIGSDDGRSSSVIEDGLDSELADFDGDVDLEDEEDEDDEADEED